MRHEKFKMPFMNLEIKPKREFSLILVDMICKRYMQIESYHYISTT